MKTTKYLTVIVGLCFTGLSLVEGVLPVNAEMQLHCEFKAEGCDGGGGGDGGRWVRDGELFHDPDYYTAEEERIEEERIRNSSGEDSSPPSGSQSPTISSDEGASDLEDYPPVCKTKPSLSQCD